LVVKVFVNNTKFRYSRAVSPTTNLGRQAAMADGGGGAEVAADVLGGEDDSVRGPTKPEPITPQVLNIHLR